MIDALSFESGRPLVRINERWYDLSCTMALKALNAIGLSDVRAERGNPKRRQERYRR
jgi:hypothetical protein